MCSTIKWFTVFFLLLILKNSSAFTIENRTLECDTQPIFRSAGDLRITIIVNECSNYSNSLSNTIILTSSWICERFNTLKVFGSLKIGADIYHTCNFENLMDPIFNVAKNNEFNLGVISWNSVPPKIRALSTVLEVPITLVVKQWRPLVTASVGILSTLHWNENVQIITDNPDILTLFYHESRKEWICVKSARSFRDKTIYNFNNPTVVFGNSAEINKFLEHNNHPKITNKLLIIPLDGSQFEALPEAAYILQPIYAEPQQTLINTRKIIPSPILIDLALPLISIAKNVTDILETNCHNRTFDKTCFREQKAHIYQQINEIYSKDVVDYLKIVPIMDRFVYNIFKVEHFDLLNQKFENQSLNSSDESVLQSLLKVGTYNIFNYTLIFDGLYLVEDENPSNETLNTTYTTDGEYICSKNHRVCITECINYKLNFDDSDNDFLLYNVFLKQESWILAVLSIASIGVVFCVAILIFIFVRLCKKDIFEGNPVLSVLLLLTLTIMYASVVPFALEVTFETEFRSTLSNYLCLVRSLAVTLSYSCCFSLMLSRSVMLATVAYEASFMSHITGHVQSLLCLFMIAVQGALSLQSIENCQDLFSNNTFLYCLSYDVLLLGLLLFSCPFIYRTQRNYKEGMYFAIAIVLIVLSWVGWLTAYVIVGDKWKMTAVCSGLLATASSILGAVFIPRTYLMTSAVVRDSITSALPSLAFASSSSVLDLNYTNAQHVYDCVNIATINATMTQAMPPVSQCNPNFYSDEPNLETTEINANSPTCESPNKVTRF